MAASNKKYGVISLFCGCGGSDLGVLGGFNFLGRRYARNRFFTFHASDINSRAVDTYNANFSEPAEVADIHDLDLTCWKKKTDLLIGGFPCQPFSTVNPTKQPGQKENQLFWAMANVIDDVRPRVFIAENVKGFYRLKNGAYFKLALNEFESLGYKMYSKLLSAADFGVPQKRERLFMVGVRSDLKFEFDFPAGPTEEGRRRRKAILADVIDSVVPDDPKYYFSKRAVEGVKKAKPNMKRALAQELGDQCLTITSHLAKVSLNSRDPVLLVDSEKELYRRFSPREAARIQSFPDEFRFIGSQGDAYRQIGNAIPPVMMWYIVRQVQGYLDAFTEGSDK